MKATLELEVRDAGDVHVLPLNDLIEHHESACCVCRPTVEEYQAGRLIVHHSADGREYFEPDGPAGVTERPS